MAKELGITVKKDEDFAEWYLQVVRKGGFKDQRTPIKGLDVFMPWGYAVWERFQKIADAKFKELGVKNAYFPMLIPRSFFEREAKHIEGFSPELLQITEAKGEKLKDPIVLRTTSETIIYHMLSQWIRSYRDLPFKVNQWANIVRWETKMTKPLVRGREFLWQEGHTAHRDRAGAVKFVERVKGAYAELHDVLALPCMVLKRTPADTFAGAEFSIAFDVCMPDGRIVQGATDHLLRDSFSKGFGIKFVDKDEKEKFVRTTSWGISERELGMMLMVHGDDNGAVLPPSVAPVQVAIVPIIFKESKKKVLQEADRVAEEVKKLGLLVEVDKREEHSPGFKFNDWELKGVPIRLEVGPKDVDKKQVIAVRRDTAKKETLKITELKKLSKMLNDMQASLFKKAVKFLDSRVNDAKTMDEMKKILEKKGGFVRTNWCGSPECEDHIKDQTGGAEIRGTLYGKKEKTFGKCVWCGAKAKHVVYVAKAY